MKTIGYTTLFRRLHQLLSILKRETKNIPCNRNIKTKLVSSLEKGLMSLQNCLVDGDLMLKATLDIQMKLICFAIALLDQKLVLKVPMLLTLVDFPRKSLLRNQCLKVADLLSKAHIIEMVRLLLFTLLILLQIHRKLTNWLKLIHHSSQIN